MSGYSEAGSFVSKISVPLCRKVFRTLDLKHIKNNHAIQWLKNPEHSATYN